MKEKWVEVNVFAIMSNHIHLTSQRQAGPVAAGLCAYPEEYKYSSAKFYESEVDDPIAIGFGFIKHWMV